MSNKDRVLYVLIGACLYLALAMYFRQPKVTVRFSAPEPPTNVYGAMTPDVAIIVQDANAIRLGSGWTFENLFIDASKHIVSGNCPGETKP